jgi:hypothetical protein
METSEHLQPITCLKTHDQNGPQISIFKLWTFGLFGGYPYNHSRILPMHYCHLISGQMRPHRSLPSSSGSMSSASSNEGNNGGIAVGTRRPPTSLSVLSSQSLAEVTKTIRERHSSLDGGLSPPPRVVSLEDSRGFKVMTELVIHDNRSIGSPPEEEKRPTNLSSRYKPLKPISTKNVK